MIIKLVNIIGITFFLWNNCNSQGIDSLWSENPDISDSAKLELLGETCYNLLYEDTSKARIICEEMLRLTPDADNIYAQINSYRTAGIVYQELQKFIDAFSAYSTAVTLSSNLKDDDGRILYGKTLSNFGTFYHKNGDFETALKMYLMADSLIDPFDIYNFKINIYAKISDVYDHLKQKEQYTYYYKKLLKIAEKAKDTLSIATSNITVSLYAIDQGNYDEAEENLKRTLLLVKPTNLDDAAFTCYYNLGLIEKLRKNYHKSIDYFKRSENFAKEWGDFYSICMSQQMLGAVYNNNGQFKEAKKILETCISLSRENEFKDVLKDALSVAINIEDTLGDYKTAFSYYKEYDKLLQEVTNLEVRKTISFLDAKYQAQKRENDIIRLESQQKIHLIKLSRNRLWIIGLIAFTLLVSVSLALILLNFSYKKKIIQQENDINKQKIAQLEKERQLTDTHAVLKGEEAERRRLARDLHDGLGGLLSGIKFNLTNMKGNFIITKENADQFDKALNLLDNSITELRRVAHNMMPEALVKYGLKDALSDFCFQMQDSEKRKISFQFYGDEKRVDNAIEISLYRIAQELLNNSFKHAKASEILVQLVQDEKRIHLTVQDNGTGFDITKVDPQKGAGLSNIKARVGSLNGQMEIDSKPGEGTEISVEFILI